MNKTLTVSVIIPTYERPEFLRETLESVWSQTILPEEIIIGDDSKSDETEHLVKAKLQSLSPVPLRYFHHQPSLREVRNVDFQFKQATSDLLLLLHDDDPLYPSCIELLRKPLEENPEAVASFGMQRMILESGALAENTEKVNTHYFRTPERAGLVDGLAAGATSMFPNNSFMVRREAALKVGYCDGGRAGLATDFYFGFRIGKLGHPFFFVPDFTAQCRITTGSQSRSGITDNAYRAVKILLEDLSPGQINSQIEKSICNRIPIAITTAIKLGDRTNAWRWLFSKYYRKRLMSPRGLKRLALALLP